MALTYMPTTSSVDMNKLFRKVQGDLVEGFNFMAEEYEMLDSLSEYKINWSAREITVPVDLNEGAGVASIPEGGYEAFPSSPSIDEITLSWVLFNKRFTATKTAKYIDQKSQAAQIRRQIVHQGKKAIQAIGTHVADYFYGFSSAVLAQVSATGLPGAGSTGTFTLKNGYGLTSINDPAFITSKIRVGDRVALVRAGVLVTNALGTVTARNLAAGTITVTWKGSVTAAADDNVVKANSMEDSTLAGTDYNRGLIGLLEMATATSLHNLSSAAAPAWSPAMTDTAAGRFGTLDLHRARQAIQDNGGGNITHILLSPGVYRDVLESKMGAVRFNDPMGLELDADLDSPKGITMKSTKRVPPGTLFAFDKKSIRKMTLLKRPKEGDAPVWDDGEKIPDKSGYVFSIDFPMQLVNLNRGNMVYFANKTEQ